MATPYFQFRHDRVPSTQDLARESVEELPVLVIAASQTEGRGRSGAGWETADRALAVSFAFRATPGDDRPFPLIAGLAAAIVADDSSLKWPNDLLVDGQKVGGILVEKSGDLVVAGLGVNLFWESPPTGAGTLFDEDPGPSRHAELGAHWGAELNRLIDGHGWPIDDYREVCVTIGEEITWDPTGRGLAVDVSMDGGLVVETDDGMQTLHSGAVRHVRSA